MPSPYYPLCLSREEGIIFFPSRAKEAKKKKKTPDLRLCYLRNSMHIMDEKSL